MRKLLGCVLCGSTVLVATVGASAQAAQETSGDSVSCSISASLGKVVCAEAPSALPPQAQITATAAPGTADPGISNLQKLQAEARSISKSASDALTSLQGQDTQSSEDTGAAEAVILQRVKQAADNLIAAAPDAGDVEANAASDGGDFCQQAADFRDHRLFQLWDGQQKKYKALTGGSGDLVSMRNRLLSDGWWAASTGAQVAIEVKGFADLVNDTLTLIVPEKTLVAGAIIHHAPEIAKALPGISVLVTYAKENAQAAAVEAGTELGSRWGGPIGAATKLLYDVAANAKSKQDAQEYRDTVQLQIRIINDTLKKLDEQRKAAVDNMDGYQEIVEAIDMVCAKKAPEQQQMLADTTPVEDAPPKKSRFANALQGFNLALGLLGQYSAAHPGSRASSVSSTYQPIGPAVSNPIYACNDPQHPSHCSSR